MEISSLIPYWKCNTLVCGYKEFSFVLWGYSYISDYVSYKGVDRPL